MTGRSAATAWAIMNYLGEEGYLHLARTIMDTAKALMEGIAAIPGLRTMGKPDMSVFAFGSESLDMNLVGDAMEARGWRLDLQQLPPCLHMMVTPVHAPIVEDFLNDLRESVEAVEKGEVTPSGMAQMYGMIGSVPTGDAENFILDFFSDLFSVK